MSRRNRSTLPPRKLKIKRLALVCGVLAVTGVLGGIGYAVQTARTTPTAILDHARTAAEQRRFPEAEKFYDEYLDYRPKDADALFEQARVYDGHARRSVADPPEARNLWKKAFACYDRGLAADPHRHDRRRELARLYLLLQKPDSARQEVQVLLREESLRDDPELYEMLAECEGTDARGKRAAADDLRAAVKTGKAPPETYLRLAYLLRMDKEVATDLAKAWAEADGLMEALVTARSNDLVARLARARYFTDTGRRLQAREDVRVAYERIPGGRENVDVILAHADAVAADDLPQARTILQHGVDTHPDHPLLGMGLAEVESRGGNKEAAKAQLVRVFDRLPAADPLALEVGDRLLDLGDAGTAEKAADRIEQTAELKPLAGYLRGRVKLAQGDWPAALPLLRQAVTAIAASPVVKRKPPLLFKANMALAAGYGLANDLTRQAETYWQASVADPGSAAARIGWAEAVSKMNRTPEAEAQLKAIAPTSPAARAQLAGLTLASGLTATGPQRLKEFWDLVGKTGPYPPDLAPTVATALAAEGKADEAEKVLAAAIKEKPTAAAFVLLAGLRAGQGKDAASAVLDDADKALGPTAEVQLARAAVLAREPKPDPVAIVALATADVPAADRPRLKTAVGELLLALGHPDRGLPLLTAVADEQKFDLGVRVVLFDWALATKDAPLRDRMLADIRRLDADPDAADAEAAKGGVTLVAEVMQELADAPRPTREANKRMTAKLRAAEQKRGGWSRIPRMLGILAAADGRPEDAVGFYDQAVKEGDRSEPLVRELLRLHFRKERYADALRVLQAVRAKGGLSPELERQFQVLAAVSGDDPAKAVAGAAGPEMAASKSYHDQVLRAQVLARFGKEDEAKKALDAALALAPAAPEVLVAKVRVLLLLGQPADKLRPEVEAAVGLLRKGNPADSAAVPLAAGQMWELVGEPAKAAAEYAAAMALNPADRDAPAFLLAVYRRTDKKADADALLAKLAGGSDADLARWARRQQAAALLAGPDAIKSVPQAVKILDQNLADGERAEDVRAKAFALCGDPRQRKAGLKLLDESRAREPLPPDDAFRLAGILVQGGRFADAEKELTAVTSNGLLADPAHLAVLVQIQCVRNDLGAAVRTVAKLKAVAPGRPDTLLEEARVLAKTDPAKAAALVLTIPTAESDAGKPLVRAKWMEAVGCAEQAEKQYREYAAGTDPPAARHAALAEFLIRSGQADKGLPLALEKAADTDIPPETTGRLLVAAVGAKPDAKGADDAARFVDAQAAKNPTNGQWVLWQAELADARGDHAGAVKKYTAAAGLFANNPLGKAVARNNAVALTVLSAREGTSDMLKQMDEVIAEVGPQPFALDTRGLVLLNMGKEGEAAEELEAAAGFAASPSNLFHLAQCYRKLKKVPEAADALERAKALGLKRERLHPLEREAFDGWK